MTNKNSTVEKLTGRDNYEDWITEVEAVLTYEGLWDVVNIEEKDAPAIDPVRCKISFQNNYACG